MLPEIALVAYTGTSIPLINKRPFHSPFSIFSLVNSKQDIVLQRLGENSAALLRDRISLSQEQRTGVGSEGWLWLSFVRWSPSHNEQGGAN